MRELLTRQLTEDWCFEFTHEGNTYTSSSEISNSKDPCPRQDEVNIMERWVNVLDEWSSYSLEQLDYMSLPQGHPLFIRRENLRRQQQLKVTAGMDQLLHDPLEEANLREIGAQCAGRSQSPDSGEGKEMTGMIHRTSTDKFLSAEVAPEANLATGAAPEVGETCRDNDADGHAAKAWSNTQKYVDERYATKARAQMAAQHSISDKNQEDTMEKMEKKNGRLCGKDPATRDESASARLPEEATLRETRQIGFWA